MAWTLWKLEDRDRDVTEAMAGKAAHGGHGLGGQSRPRTDRVGDRYWRLRPHAPLRHAGAAQGCRGAAELKKEIESRGLEICAFNCWGNPMHPDESIAGA